MKIENYSFIAVSCVLASCAAVYQNVSPNEPSAKIRFVDLTGGGSDNRFISLFGNEICKDRKFVASLSGIAIKSNRQSLDMPLGEDFSNSSKTEIIVAPGPLVYSIGVSTGGNYFNGIRLSSKSCGASNAFNVIQNKYYEATFELQEGKCVSKVYQLILGEHGSYSRLIESSSHPTEETCPVAGAEAM